MKTGIMNQALLILSLVAIGGCCVLGLRLSRLSHRVRDLEGVASDARAEPAGLGGNTQATGAERAPSPDEIEMRKAMKVLRELSRA